LGNSLTQAVDAGIENLPPGLQSAARLLRNTPPDGIAAGAVLNLPGNRKMGLFLIQPTQPGNLLPNFSKPPVVFFSVPSMGIVGTFNPANGQVELGGGATMPVTGVPDTVFFYNVRQGRRVTGDGDVTSTSGNFGYLNSTVSDPIAKWVISKGSTAITHIARALEGAGLLGDIATAPTSEGVVGAVTVEAVRLLLVDQLQRQTKFFVGPAWRGADFEQYPNGESILNISGGRIRLSEGDGPGGSGLPDSAFAADLPNFLGTLFGDVNRRDILTATNDPVAERLASVLYSAYLEGDHAPAYALGWTRAAYDEGGKAALAERALNVLGVNTPNSVNDRAFVRIGMGEQAATLAKGIYDYLRQEGDQNGLFYSPQQAWSAVWANYIEGNHGVVNTGVRNGGDAGGFNALRALAAEIGMDPTPYLPRNLR
jgi:hypothetical protein